jgi:hypothetical protein
MKPVPGSTQRKPPYAATGTYIIRPLHFSIFPRAFEHDILKRRGPLLDLVQGSNRIDHLDP